MNIKVEEKNDEEENIDLSFFLVPFIPSQPSEILKSGDIYLKSIDKNHRRCYEKFIMTGKSVDDKEEDKNKYIQQLYVNNEDRFLFYFILFFF